MYKLGIDIGYSTFKYVILDENNTLIRKGYFFHKGKIEEQYHQLMNELKALSVNEIALGLIGNLSTRLPIQEKYSINQMRALVEGALMIDSNIKSIIEIGAQDTHFINGIQFGQRSHLNFYTNSSCAAGTGAFLEEQATRLGIKVEALSEYVKRATSVPRIAGRCSVFSKTDMIHHMQEGTSLNDILLGLCYALVRNFKSNVVQKHEVQKPVLLAGGVIYNEGIVRAIKEVFNLKDEEIILNQHELTACYGACKIAAEKGQVIKVEELLEEKEITKKVAHKPSIFEPLSEWGKGDSKDKHQCTSSQKEGYLGIDIGSTSTNLVVVDENNEVVDYIYTKTEGKPKEMVLQSIETIKDRLGPDFVIKGIGTTGSGRVMIGKLLGADFIVNEITAQAKGATIVEQGVDTIFEIGGQDSKYIHLNKGLVNNFEMNKICAAGTGAFIEEQIKKLGIDLEAFGEYALKGKHPANLGDRCTVFIEGNIGKALAEGETLEDIAAGLSYAIVKNYLNRVVGNRQIGNKILLQGGIAYNQGVVNAFRAVLGKEIIVPPFFSVTGALGMAVLTKEHLKEKVVNEQKVSNEVKEKSEQYFLEGYTGKLDSNKKTIGIPRVLFINKMFPMFHEIFVKLGYNVLLSKASNEEIVALSQQYAFEETCFPVKLITGHVAWLLQHQVDYIFLPQLYTMKHAGSTAREDYACVYMQTSPKIMESIFDLQGKVELIAPTLSFNFGKEYMIQTLLSIGKQLGKNKVQTTLAVMSGMKKFMQYEKAMEQLGKEAIGQIKSNQKVFVLVSRVYNLVDPTLNMGIEDKLKEMGYPVLHLGHLEANHMSLSEEYQDMCWPFGQHILTAAREVKQHENMFPIYITNHGCGPDTVLSHYFKEEMGDKPYLHIEIDEHSSKIGILTRLEAFVYSLNQYQRNNEIEAGKKRKKAEGEKQYLLPNLPYYSEVMKAFLERQGHSVKVFSEINDYSLEKGKRFATSKEYFSMIASLGEAMEEVEASGEVQKLYFPMTEGNETFSQYGNMIRLKAKEIGKELELEAPFIEEYLGDSRWGMEWVYAIMACDLIWLLPEEERAKALEKVVAAIHHQKMNRDQVIQVAIEVKKFSKVSKGQKRILVVGEPLVVYKPYLNQGSLKELEKECYVMRQPLSEVLYTLWKDYSYKRQKKNIVYCKLLEEIKESTKQIHSILEKASPFSEDIDEMLSTLDHILPKYAGGAGRYRLAKQLNSQQVDGVLNMYSMYENTATILKMLREKHKKEESLPVLDLSFDCNQKMQYREQLETFLSYL